MIPIKDKYKLFILHKNTWKTEWLISNSNTNLTLNCVKTNDWYEIELLVLDRNTWNNLYANQLI